jgi:hypothetical protein
MISFYRPAQSALEGAGASIQTPGKSMYQTKGNSFTHRLRVFFVWLCLVLFTASGFVESAHFHRSASSSEQHCSLCIASHSVARPAHIANLVNAPSFCVAVLLFGRPLLPDLQSTLTLYIRPPPLA